MLISKFTGVIGIATSPFMGVFNGQGHRILVDIQKDRQTGVGFFGYTQNAVIKNLTIKGEVKGFNSVGGIVGHGTNTTVEYCTNLAKARAVGYTNNTIPDFPPDIIGVFSSSPTSNYVYGGPCGGIVGYGTGTMVIYRCVNGGEITADGGAAGIIAASNNNATISFCVNLGTIKAAYHYGGVGGINAGGATTIQYCHNAGCIIGAYGGSTGGIIASNTKTNSIISYCLNTGAVQYFSNGGGARGVIAGNNNTTSNISNCFYDKQMCVE